ncbi:hypothetical protein [Streptomyces flaveolus]|jgi:hypothetical protein|uniref:hypothetical protein n=1 Tax=Streptomyces flaveolus TaxID=67297 RepID=UPI001671772C|nr:hypothetical protein [Streptomyces flaveolus]GGQ81823.1 hypothetical protein GCM10010216_49640 [Streptomyces flaveolus]
MSNHTTPPPAPPYWPPVPPQPPKQNRTALIAVAAAVVAAAVTAAVTVGVTGDDEAEPAPTVTVTETVGAGDTTAADEETEPAPEASDDGVYALGDTVTYDGEVRVGLSGFKRAVSTDTAMPESTPYVRFTVKVDNGGSETLDATALSVNCSYGKDGHSSEAVFDSATGLNGGPDTQLLAGRSINVPWGCTLPKGEKLVQIEVVPDYESDTAIFTGEIK